MKNCYYGNIYHSEQRYSRTDIWSILLDEWGKVWETVLAISSWVKLRIKWHLAKFATLSNRVVNDYFDHICHTEQRYGRSDNLISFTTLGETQIRWFFGQIYYPGKNCWKMRFGHFHYIELKMWEITTLTGFAIESKSVQKFIFDRFCPFGQKPDKCQFCYLVWHPCKCLDKVKVILVLTR